MVRAKLLGFFLLFLLALAFTSAHYYDSDNSNNDEYYWADEYYHTGDYYESSSQNYRSNTYYNGEDFDRFEEYSDYVYYKNHPWMSVYEASNQRDDYSRGQYYYDSDYNYYNYDYDFPGVEGRYIYYSSILDKYSEEECYYVAPSSSLFYIKC